MASGRIWSWPTDNVSACERVRRIRVKRPDLSQLVGRQFDLLIIGGGITGAAVARDAALRGLRVVLLEKDDFAGGTSSKSSKLIHGGLRYLEHGDLRLVMEGCRERRLLLRNARHLVHPLPFVIPIHDEDLRGPWQWRIGLWLYDLLAAFRNVARHRIVTPEDLCRLEPNLTPDHLRLGGVYYDAGMQDARLCVETLRSAAAAGAQCMNYARVVGLNRDSAGRLVGAKVRDVLSGLERDVSADVVVNAAGPWADRCAALSDRGAAPRLRLSKGVHLVTRRITRDHAVLFTGPVDGRILIIVPWLNHTLIGTTDTDYHGSPDDVEATPEDVSYLLEAACSILPGAKLTRKDVVATMVGVRPLLDEPGKPPSDLSRAHRLICDPHGLISVVGGKYTTHRSMAAETVDRVIRQLRRTGHLDRIKAIDTAQIPLPGGDVTDWSAFAADAASRLVETFNLGREVADHLVGTYGTAVDRVVEPCRREPWLAERLCPDHPHILAEALWAFEHEMAFDAADFFFRRTSIGYGECGGERCAERLIGALNRLGIAAAGDRERFLARWRRERQQTTAALRLPPG